MESKGVAIRYEYDAFGHVEKDKLYRKLMILLPGLTDDTLLLLDNKITVKTKCRSAQKMYATALIESLIESPKFVRYLLSPIVTVRQVTVMLQINQMVREPIVKVYIKKGDATTKYPLKIILAHEVIHAYLGMTGKSTQTSINKEIAYYMSDKKIFQTNKLDIAPI